MKNMRFYLSMLFVCISLSIVAQNFTVTGIVKDDLGEPVIGASVLEKGTTNGTITNVDGEFSLSVSGQHPLVISYIGMQTQEVSVKNKKKVEVTLQSSAVALDEVVAIGYATTRKKDLTGSVTSLGSAEIAKVPVTNAAEALTGRMAGVRVTTSDGSPDAEVIIRVRGGGSITGDNSPLYIVDGFPVSSINDIPPTDIQSIDVLKDASSSAIYGSQGANGVVIITTKSAKEGKTQVSYNGYVQSKHLAKRLDVLDPYEFVRYQYELMSFDGETGIKNFNKKFGVYEDMDLYRYQPLNDGQEEMFGGNKISQMHNLSLNGGNDKTKFALSGTYNKDDGLMATDNFSRFSTNFKLSQKIAKNVNFNFNSRFSDTEVNGSGTAGGSYKVRTHQAINKPATNGLSDFTIVDREDMDDDEWDEYLKSQMSLAEQAAQYWKKRNNRTFNFSASVDWEIIKGLTYRLEGGYDYGFNDTKNYWGELTSNASYVGGKPLVDWTKQNTNKYRFANTLTYRQQIKKHRYDVMLGQEINSAWRSEAYMYATHFSTDMDPDKIFANLASGDGNINLTSKFTAKENLASFFGRANYTFADRYMMTVTFRADGSSKFAPGKQWGYFPSAALAWRISEEEFMIDASQWLSNLKLRISYGEAGNNRIASGLFRPTYSINANKTYGWQDKQNNYYAPASKLLPNPNLKWETTITRNAGIDFGFMKERLSGTLDVYWNTASDLLIERNIVAPGYEKTMENIGKTSNKGVELALNGTILQKKNYSLTANFNIGINRSKVDKLANGITMQEYASGWAGTDLKGYNDYRIMVGQPVGLIYGFVTDGYYTTNDFERYDPATKKYILKEGVATNSLGGKIGVRPGTLKLKDLNNDGVIDDNDRQIIGKTDPKFAGGFGLNGTYRGFDASMMFSFVYGNKVYNANKLATSQTYRASYSNLLGFMNSDNVYTYLDNAGNIVTDLDQLAAMNEGTNAKQYWSPHSIGNATAIPHSWAMEDGSFLRLQNVTVGYTLPVKLTKKFACQNLRVYCTLNNVFCWTNYTGYDPEVTTAVRGSSVSGLTPGVDFSAYPKSFSWLLGLNITF